MMYQCACFGSFISCTGYSVDLSNTTSCHRSLHDHNSYLLQLKAGFAIDSYQKLIKASIADKSMIMQQISKVGNKYECARRFTQKHSGFIRNLSVKLVYKEQENELLVASEEQRLPP